VTVAGHFRLHALSQVQADRVVARIFVNYRGLDSHSYAALLHTALVQEFGDDLVFIDSDSIPAGADFATTLLDAVRSARFVLALIGPDWLSDRLVDDPEDWVRRELVEAFAVGTTVIPVLTDDARLPKAAELPADLAPLASCQYRRLRRRDKTGDLARIVADLRRADPLLASSCRVTWWPSLRDPYRRRARIAPALLAALPAVLLAGLAMPAAGSLLAEVAAVLLTGGLPMLADQLGRQRGKRIEPHLFESWGGKPTTQLLRWRGPTSRAAQDRQRACLLPWCGALPSKEAERADPIGSDEDYDAAVRVLRASQRGSKRLVFVENCNYGFRRNMLGLRPYGLGIALAALACAVAFVPRPAFFVASAVDAALACVWLWVVTPSWVAEAAWAYAERLLEVVLPYGAGSDTQPQSRASRPVVEP
jgi:TIR domain-containing protein